MATDYVPAKVPTVGVIISILLQMSTFGVLVVCIMRRTQFIQKWASMPLAIWLIILVYFDAAIFVFATAIIVHGLGINSSPSICEGGILLCLVCYMTTKLLIYYFLVEKVYVVRGRMQPRWKTKLWLFNCIFVLLPYTVFAILNFIYRITYINKEGVCIIGMQRIAMLPLITFEVIINIYLTILFIMPLRSLYSVKNNHNSALSRVACRSFIGSCATLTASVVNLSILMVLRGEPGWICLMCCNADILFCVLVIHWATSKDKVTASTYHNTLASHRTQPVDTPHRASNVECVAENAAKEQGVILTGEPRLQGVVTTVCKSDGPPQSSKLGHMQISGLMIMAETTVEDKMELHNIRVRTVHTMEVEINRAMRNRRESIISDEEEWASDEQSVVGENMV